MATQDVLDWIEEITGVKIYEIPKGKTSRSRECPIAHALNYATREEWHVSNTHATSHSNTVDLPNHVIAWIRDFDQGTYPELEE